MESINITNDDEVVQVSFTNLVKRAPTTTEIANVKTFKKIKLATETINIENKDKFEILGVIVDSRMYRFSSNKLYDLEPNNTLMNLHSGEFKKRINPRNHTLEYLQPMTDFNLVIDYINGYDANEFQKIFKQNYSRVDDFKIMVSELNMINLLKIMDYNYPVLNINSLLVNISRKYVMYLEPHNIFLNLSYMSVSNVFTHFTDKDIFYEYFLEYIQGKSNSSQVINKIKELEINKSNENDYKLAKIKHDLRFYSLFNLRQKIEISQNL
jgi:hypothetical protein